MSGITVIGNKEFVLGFKLAGVKGTFVEEKNIEERLRTVLIEKHAGIIVLHDTDYKMLSSSMKKKANESMDPVVIAIGKLDEINIREKIKKAIGIDLYKPGK